MADIKKIVAEINRNALGGAKIPHSVSNPVLRTVDNVLYIAAFIYVYNRDNLQQNKMPRPIHWLVADIATGEIQNEFDCREHDFTNENFNELYDLNDPDKKMPTKEDFEEIYTLFDSVRTKYINEGVFDTYSYNIYLNKILEVTPSNYRKFYKDLSNL